MHEHEIVWVVDDDEAVATVAAKVLGGVGEFDCQIFSSAGRISKSTPSWCVACVVSDVRMPHIDGTQLQQKLLEIDDTVSILFLTGHADVPTAVQLMEQGAVTLLKSPMLLMTWFAQCAKRCDVVRASAGNEPNWLRRRSGLNS